MDPLKPFNSIVRSIWTRETRRTDAAEKNIAQPSQTEELRSVDESRPVLPLTSQLRTRIQQIGPWDGKRAREIFVESILLSELGIDLARDPSFGGVVQKISRQLESDAALTLRLDTLLREMAHEAIE